MSLETRKKMSESHKGLVVGYKFKKGNKVNLGRVQPIEEREKRGLILKGKKRNKDTKEKMSKARIEYMATHQAKFSNTDIEILVEKMLIENKIAFLKQVPIKGIALVDFYLPQSKTIIECDGDYWHSKPEVQEKDEKKNKLFTDFGYRVIRLKGSVIKSMKLEDFNKAIQ